MCEPVTATLAIASTALGLYNQRETARRQQRFHNRSAQQQQDQINQSQSRQANQRARRARAERARLRALSAETGLTGTTMDTVLNNVDAQAGLDISTIEQQRDNALADSMLTNQSNLNTIRQPDYLGAALNTGLTLGEMRERQRTPTGA